MATILTSCTPNRDVVKGGRAVVLVGSGFTGITRATFGGVAATGFAVADDQHINCNIPPAAAPGVVDIALWKDVQVVSGSGLPSKVYGGGNVYSPVTVNAPAFSTAEPLMIVVAITEQYTVLDGNPHSVADITSVTGSTLGAFTRLCGYRYPSNFNNTLTAGGWGTWLYAKAAAGTLTNEVISVVTAGTLQGGSNANLPVSVCGIRNCVGFGGSAATYQTGPSVTNTLTASAAGSMIIGVTNSLYGGGANAGLAPGAGNTLVSDNNNASNAAPEQRIFFVTAPTVGPGAVNVVTQSNVNDGLGYIQVVAIAEALSV